jgi:pectinesterase
MMHRRAVLAGLAASSLAAAARASDAFDAVVSRTRRGSNVYASVAEAVAAAPGDRPFHILVTAGEWRERVTVTTPNIALTGEGPDKTRIVFNASAGDPGPGGKPIGTFGTPTVRVQATGFSARHLTFANDFDYKGHIVKPSLLDDKPSPVGTQAVALAVERGADRCFVDDCHFDAYHDTLFVDAGRSLFRACLIEGCVDFIFGAGRAVFEACEIRSRLRPPGDFNGYIAAPDTNRYQPYGFLFSHCRLSKEADVAAKTVALGRPWRRTGTFSDGRYGDPDAVGAATFADCWMDDHIVTEGWYPMGYTAKDGTRTEMQPEEARFYEFGSTGPGAGVASARRRILTPAAAAPFTPQKVLEGWQP